MVEILWRSAQFKDIEAIVEVLQGISSYRPEVESLESIWGEFIAQSDLTTIVADHEAEIIGFGTLLIETKIRGGRVGHLEDIAIHSEHRGKGLGRNLVRILTEIAFEKGCYKVVAHCHERNLAFYEKCGYTSENLSIHLFAES